MSFTTRDWPEDFWRAFGDMPKDFERPAQGRQQRECLLRPHPTAVGDSSAAPCRGASPGCRRREKRAVASTRAPASQ